MMALIILFPNLQCQREGKRLRKCYHSLSLCTECMMKSVIHVFSPSLPWGREGWGGMGKLWSAKLWVHLFFSILLWSLLQREVGEYWLVCDYHKGYEYSMNKVATKIQNFPNNLKALESCLKIPGLVLHVSIFFTLHLEGYRWSLSSKIWKIKM